MIAPGPLIDAALALTLCALLSLLFVLRVKARNEPSVAEYLSAPMAADPANRTALAMSLAEDFEARCELVRIVIVDEDVALEINDDVVGTPNRA